MACECHIPPFLTKSLTLSLPGFILPGMYPRDCKSFFNLALILDLRIFPGDSKPSLSSLRNSTSRGSSLARSFCSKGSFTISHRWSWGEASYNQFFQRIPVTAAIPKPRAPIIASNGMARSPDPAFFKRFTPSLFGASTPT